MCQWIDIHDQGLDENDQFTAEELANYEKELEKEEAGKHPDDASEHHEPDAEHHQDGKKHAADGVSGMLPICVKNVFLIAFIPNLGPRVPLRRNFGRWGRKKCPGDDFGGYVQYLMATYALKARTNLSNVFLH